MSRKRSRQSISGAPDGCFHKDDNVPLSINAISVSSEQLSPFVGLSVVPPDGQIKASAMRFLASSSPSFHHRSCVGDFTDKSIDPQTIEEAHVAILNRFVCNLFPPNTHNKIWGTFDDLPSYLKRVMTKSFPRYAYDEATEGVRLPAVYPPSSTDINIKFNKMSGMQEFANSLALFVNLDKSTYDNLFVFHSPPDSTPTNSNDVDVPQDEPSIKRKEGDLVDGPSLDQDSTSGDSIPLSLEKYSRGKLFMTFYAQPRHHAETPIICRLLDRIRRGSGETTDVSVTHSSDVSEPLSPKKPPTSSTSCGDTEDSTDAPSVASVRPLDSILLFCRFPSQPYMYWGELDPVAAYLEERPIKFVFELQNFAQLLSTPAFLQLVQEIDVVDLQ